MKTFLIIFSFSAICLVNDTPDFIGTPFIKADYFWNPTRNAKFLKSKSKIYTETIINGYYAKKEFLTFTDKKLSSVKYIENADTNSVTTITNGDGYLMGQHPGDTLQIKNGKLNGKSFIYFHYIQPDGYKLKNKFVPTDVDRYVMDFKDNFLKSMLVYIKGILIYESYYKNYDFVREGQHKVKNDGNFRDSVLNVYNANGSLRSSLKF